MAELQAHYASSHMSWLRVWTTPSCDPKQFLLAIFEEQ